MTTTTVRAEDATRGELRRPLPRERRHLWRLTPPARLPASHRHLRRLTAPARLPASHRHLTVSNGAGAAKAAAKRAPSPMASNGAGSASGVAPLPGTQIEKLDASAIRELLWPIGQDAPETSVRS